MGHTLASWQVTAAVIVFLITYAIIISEKINRAVIALLGAVVMLVLQIVDVHTAFTTHIEWNTLFLLVGMMILVGITNKSGIFQYAAVKAAQRAKGYPKRIMLIMFLLTAVGSAFLDNVTTVLLMVPITFSITRMLKMNPVPFLIAEIIASNVGGTATLIGDPPNIMIGSANKHLTFNMFLAQLAPVVLVIALVIIVCLLFIYRKQLQVSDEQRQALMELSAASYITDAKLVKKSLTVLILTIIGFALHSVIHVEAAVVAMAGATILMLIGLKSEEELEEALHQVEWVTILFFIGLFILVGGLIEAGIINRLAELTLGLTNGDMTKTSMLVLWVSGVASATIDNIPFVATMIPLLQDIGTQMGITDPNQLNPLWWSLALGACLGGNGTLIGASANVIVAGMAQREGNGFGYMDFLKIGAPITIISLLISTGYILLFIL
ncbi:ArsB/NhaD family transporter [Paenibacillus alvei]|uniref:ArsB/NhaD family transporter n=2 Tax=Paenibacillus TaxID=44249 RepID=A0ABT4H385_PAEAL|nr:MULTISPECIES: ArsB/NhaD family transporter [Paenibacillus]EJW17088.1 putative transporter [Paenibacillus alvei DSM 29]MCY7483941.1 ArsB/NhaD family transporter [Paenibacillus alvei]MCY9541557.1 ArsB/NhaD family transporter [Paenibacillus alvei]MCY9705225.1 ArsB/NhaD family transporter [Paenibacillus alvei]MCY9734953.1 ArsB/NhaD family transporter [Paenibacillus alvei]